MPDRAAIDALFPADLPGPDHWERRYPPRQLAEDAKVTRIAPSPTGFMHIGTIYVAMIDSDVAHRSGGRYLVRVEDTDQARLVDGAVDQFAGAFSYFGLLPDEDDSSGDYGPYHQSAREASYLSYARELLRAGKAYLCFATTDELADIRRRQQEAKTPTGYYGEWAVWRDASEADVQAKLDQGAPYVVRFRSPGRTGARAEFTDAIRGPLSAEDNFNDVVILKSSDQPVRLPTYHFAHAVDEHLMRVNLVIRAEEWLSSVPLHLQLFHALGFEPPEFAHVAPLMKQIPGGKRKLSKRKDPEASVDFYIQAGYPADAVLYYLRGLANGRLAEIPLAQALAEPIRLAECGTAGPLVDPVKLEDISADYIATLSGEQILAAMRTWAAEYDTELAGVLAAEPELALAALAVERDGVGNPRKDLRKWSDFRAAYGFFFPALFTLVGPRDERLGQMPPDLVRAFAADFAAGYQDLTDRQEWFGQIRELAAKHGFAPNAKQYRQDPAAYPGSISEASQLIRVALTGSTQSPDLASVARVLGRDEVLRRVRPISVGRMTQMSDAEWREFVMTGTRTGKLAVTRRDGRPHVTPIWFVLDGDDVVLTTHETSAKARALRRESRAALCVDDQQPPYSYVMLEGRAALSGDLDELRRWATVIGGRYMGADRAEEFGARNGVPGELLVRLRVTNIVARRDVAG